jgi:hypothetical protein
MEAGGIFQHLPALFQVMGLKCAKYDSKAQKDSKRDMAVVPALIRQSLCEKACKAMFLPRNLMWSLYKPLMLSSE